MSGPATAARRTALIAAAFSAIVCVALIANYVSMRAYDPIPPANLQSLQLALNRDATNEALKAKVRHEDLALRRRYFQGRAFALHGLYLLIGGVAAFLLASEVARAQRRDLPEPDPEAPRKALDSLVVGRRSAVVLAVVFGGGLVTMAVVSRHDTSAEYAKAALRAPMFQPQAKAEPQPQQQSADTGLPALNGGAPAREQPLGGSLSPGGTSLQPLPVGETKVVTPLHPAGAPQQIVALYPKGWETQWPRFRGPGGNGVATVKDAPIRWDGAKGQGIVWKSPVPLPGWNSPVVWGNRIFLSGADATRREVYCFDAATGKRIWATPIAPATGKVKVTADTGYAPSTLATDGSRVCAIFPSGDVACLDFTGKLLWLRRLGIPDNQYGHASSLLIYGNGLIVQLDQGTDSGDGKSVLLALSLADGKTVWQVKRPVQGSWTTPVIVKAAGRDELITVATPWVVAYEPRTGKELWRAQCMSGDVAPSPTFGGGFVFVTNSGAVLAAIRADGTGDVTTSGIAWQATDGLPDISSPLATGELVFLCAPDGTVTCLEQKTGTKLWDHSFGTPFKASPTLVGSRVYLLDTAGVTHVIEAARAFKLVSTCPLGEAASASPAFAGGRIYLRGEHNVYCVGAK